MSENNVGLLNRDYYDKHLLEVMNDQLASFRRWHQDNLLSKARRRLHDPDSLPPVALTVKALTVTQPYAQFLAIGEKGFETRSWGTKYRGTVFIHAGMRLPRAGSPEDAISRELLRGSSKLSDVALEELPRGMIIGCGVLADCIKMDAAFCAAIEDTREGELGGYEPGRYAWKFEDVVLLDESDRIPIAGKLSLWDLRI